MATRLLHIFIAASAMVFTASAQNVAEGIRIAGTKCDRVDSDMVLSSVISLDSLRLDANRQIFITPVMSGPDNRRIVFPTVLVNGRNMHYVYERAGLSKDQRNRYGNLQQAVRRHNGKAESIDYLAKVPAERWMMNPAALVAFTLDTCGCGINLGSVVGDSIPVAENPAGLMRLAYVTPKVTELPVSVHEGKAKVQFEVDKTVLHDTPYRTPRGMLIDNVAQLRMIDDSVSYALSDPNVEIAAINICGYASPESPYIHNDELATGRSRALAEYLAQKYNLPADRSHYSAVPENWEGFRMQVLASQNITDKQRADLLALIDTPAYGPSDYDAKERALKTDRRFATLYRTEILPKWFPELRVTKFEIHTRLKPMSDTKLAEVIQKTPEMLSLNQMMRVARLYPEGSPEFNSTIETSLKYYPEDTVAIVNAAIAALDAGDNERADMLLQRADASPEAENARGVLETRRGNYDEALRHFRAAETLPEAVKNRTFVEW